MLPLVERMAIIGPDQIAPGETAQFRVEGYYSDGTTRDVTENALWTVQSGGSSLRTMEGAGRFTALQDGDARITGSFYGWVSIRDVRVRTPGTFKLRGDVIEAAPAVGGVGGAVVTVLDDPSLSSTTSPGGSFALYRVRPGVTLHVTKEGYSSASLQVASSSEASSVQITMARVAPVEDLSGFYTMVITTDPDCEQSSLYYQGPFSPLPDHLTVRTYVTQVLQNVNRLRVRVAGPNVIGGAGTPLVNEYEGQVDPRQLSFSLGLHDPSNFVDFPQGIIELISPTSYLLVEGAVSISTDTMTGTLRGALQLTGAPSLMQPPTATCVSDQHRVELRR
jgi:hypothetical protein